jgi:endonuclease G
MTLLKNWFLLPFGLLIVGITAIEPPADTLVENKTKKLGTSPAGHTKNLYTHYQQPATDPRFEIPRINKGDYVITHTGFSLLYNEEHEQASWVAYELTKEETNKLYDRTDKFIPDPKVKTGTANNSDYAGSGYDRGHLAPAADMGWSLASMTESFYFSNMSPQTKEFNRGIWKKLEELVRTWAVENNSIYVVTGPILKPGLPTIGINKVSIPEQYYKVILDFSQPELKGIGFIMANAGSKEALQSFAVPIETVEQYTGIDFFPSLSKEEEILLEKRICIPCWSWKSNTYNGKKDTRTNTGSVQCSGITKAGNRCKRMTRSPNGKCYQHGGD